MKTILTTIANVFGFLPCAAFVIGLFPGLSRASDIIVTVMPASAPYLIGEPVILCCTYTNSSDVPKTLDLGGNEIRGVALDIKAEADNENIRLSTPVYCAPVYPGTFTIAPHGSERRYLLLDPWFRPTRPGRFRVRMSVQSGETKIHTAFELSFIQAPAGVLKQRLQHMATSFAEATHLKNNSEYYSYERAFLFALTYVADLPDIYSTISAPVENKKCINRLMGAAKIMGPGGIHSLD
jgi:hypothetical protein